MQQSKLNCFALFLKTLFIEMSVLVINSNKINDICRICMASGSNLIDVFSQGKSVTIAADIMTCASVNISTEDGLPSVICTNCKYQLDVALNFRFQCQQTDILLHQCFGHKSDSSVSLEHPLYIMTDLNTESLNTSFVIDDHNLKSETIVNCLSNVTNEHRSKYDESRCDEKQFVCGVCVKEFSNRKQLSEHFFIHIQDRLFDSKDFEADNFDTDASSECERPKTNAKRVSKESKNSSSSSNKKQLHCNICNEYFLYQESFTRHICKIPVNNCAVKTKSYNCTDCNSIFSQKRALVNHVCLSQPLFRNKMALQCEYCGKKFFKKSYYKAHKLRHSDYKRYVCTACGKQFKYLFTLEKHMFAHKDGGIYSCRVCCKRFKTRAGVINHGTSHAEEKPFVCKICNKRFTIVSHLREHQKIHNKEEEYICDICGRRFRFKSALNRHNKVLHCGIRDVRKKKCVNQEQPVQD